MAQFERTVSVTLSVAEVEKIIRDALRMPPDATVNFELGYIGSTLTVTSVEASYIERPEPYHEERGGWNDR